MGQYDRNRLPPFRCLDETATMGMEDRQGFQQQMACGGANTRLPYRPPVITAYQCTPAPSSSDSSSVISEADIESYLFTPVSTQPFHKTPIAIPPPDQRTRHGSVSSRSQRSLSRSSDKPRHVRITKRRAYLGSASDQAPLQVRAKPDKKVKERGARHTLAKDMQDAEDVAECALGYTTLHTQTPSNYLLSGLKYDKTAFSHGLTHAFTILSQRALYAALKEDIKNGDEVDRPRYDHERARLKALLERCATKKDFDPMEDTWFYGGPAEKRCAPDPSDPKSKRCLFHRSDGYEDYVRCRKARKQAIYDLNVDRAVAKLVERRTARCQTVSRPAGP